MFWRSLFGRWHLCEKMALSMEVCTLNIDSDVQSFVRRIKSFLYHLTFHWRSQNGAQLQLLNEISAVNWSGVSSLHRNWVLLSLYTAHRKHVHYRPGTPRLISLYLLLWQCLPLEPRIFLVSTQEWKLNVKLVSDISEETDLKNRNMTRRNV